MVTTPCSRRCPLCWCSASCRTGLGRRRVTVAGLVASTAGLALFALARDTAWLFAARAVQGLAVGMISGAAAAALVELEPPHDRGLVATEALGWADALRAEGTFVEHLRCVTGG